MSLENEIKKNTEAVLKNNELLEKLLENGVSAPSTAAAPAEETPAKEEKPAKTKEKPAAKEEPKEEASEKKITIKDIRAIARPLIKNNQSDEVAEVLADFGADSITELDEKHYAKAHAAISKIELNEE